MGNGNMTAGEAGFAHAMNTLNDIKALEKRVKELEMNKHEEELLVVALGEVIKELERYHKTGMYSMKTARKCYDEYREMKRSKPQGEIGKGQCEN